MSTIWALEIRQVGLNFSRPAAQILGQYYQFIRLGFEGYKNIQANSLAIAKYLHGQVSGMPEFQAYSQDVPNPIFTWLMKPECQKTAKWTLFDLQDKLAQKGWMVPSIYVACQHTGYSGDACALQAGLQQGHGRPAAE